MKSYEVTSSKYFTKHEQYYSNSLILKLYEEIQMTPLSFYKLNLVLFIFYQNFILFNQVIPIFLQPN